MKSRRHAFGQNFLHHQPTIQKIIDLAKKEIEDCSPKAILEIGPGKKAITDHLVELAKIHHFPLYLVEKDLRLKEGIESDFSESFKPEFHYFDAAHEELTELVKQIATSSKVMVVSNLPYSASTQIIARLCHASSSISSMVLMVQKEVAERMVAKTATADRGAFSLLVQSYFKITKAFDVGPGAFSPPPKVTSTVLVFKPLEKPLVSDLKDPLLFERFCKMLFSHRRKMIRHFFKEDEMSGLGLKGTERPENLELLTALELFKRKGNL